MEKASYHGSRARRITYVLSSYLDGGAEVFTAQLASCMRREGWSVSVLQVRQPDLPRLPGRLAAAGIPYRVHPVRIDRPAAVRIARMIQLLRRERAHLFHFVFSSLTNQWEGVLAARLLGRPAVVGFVSVEPVVVRHWKERALLRIVLPALLGRRAVPVAVSSLNRTQLSGYFGMPPRRIPLILNAVDLERMPAPTPEDRRRARDRFGLGLRDVAVVTAVGLNPAKGVEDLLEAALQVESVCFLIAGHGPMEPALRERVRALKMEQRVRFLGFVRSVPELLAAADLFVLPSRWEGLPLVLLEAMAHGCAVVATAVAGTLDVIEDGATGVLVPPRDPAALAGAIGSLAADPERRGRLGASARERILRCHRYEEMARRYADLYDSLVD